jgi:hypothetical protein
LPKKCAQSRNWTPVTQVTDEHLTHWATSTCWYQPLQKWLISRFPCKASRQQRHKRLQDHWRSLWTLWSNNSFFNDYLLEKACWWRKLPLLTSSKKKKKTDIGRK